jgi:hypothetical protein
MTSETKIKPKKYMCYFFQYLSSLSTYLFLIILHFFYAIFYIYKLIFKILEKYLQINTQNPNFFYQPTILTQLKTKLMNDAAMQLMLM